MKRALLYIGILTTLLSCSRNAFLPQAGDLLFQANKTSAMTDAITEATTRTDEIRYSHVAIALGADSVIEASSGGGVRIVSLREFLDASALASGKPVVTVMRIEGLGQQIGKTIEKARTYLGQPYDFSYRPGNGKMYCSELVWESFVGRDGQRLFTARPMNFRAADGTLPHFWIELFEGLDEPIPEGIPGTNPADMAKECLLKEVHRYY